MPDLLKDNKIKAIAFYLPQFYPIPENDAAWGKGFTEWNNVRKAVPLYEGHYQPRIPLDKNYYSLVDQPVSSIPQCKTQIWQAELAAKYGVYGFCYYHYWLGNGKQLLEKPAENMLLNKNVNIPFCFSWANHSWMKIWNSGDNKIIAQQNYGDKHEWKTHFDYLLNFFLDDRYITVGGKPIFIIYQPEDVPQLEEMMRSFQIWAKESGLPGICFMSQYSSYYLLYTQRKVNADLFDYIISFEPPAAAIGRTIIQRIIDKSKNIIQKTICKYEKNVSVKVFINYDETWKKILQKKFDPKIARGAFTGWDNTSRYGKDGSVIEGSSPEKFYKYVSALVKKMRKNNSFPAFFITAWNEWGEGCYLEPDEKFRFGYLEAIKSLKEQGLIG
ncbi:glycosyl transferase [Synergistales bacterium]|nr:glycosyl transferase [Synergistales bacterium]